MHINGNRDSRPHRIDLLAQLRVLVGYRGEKDQFNWWPTSFLSPTGRRYLEFNFPRTVLSAGVNSVAHAAKTLHDQRIGRSSVFHLFRLPHAVEQDIHAVLSSSPQDLIALIQGQDNALRALETIAEGQVISDLGPVRISSTAQLLHRTTVKKVAAYYRAAFANGNPTFPYFTAE